MLKEMFRQRKKHKREDFSGGLGRKWFDLADLRDERDRAV